MWMFTLFFYYAPDYNPEAYYVDCCHEKVKVEIVETLGDGYGQESIYQGKSVSEDAYNLKRYNDYLKLVVEYDMYDFSH